MSTTKKDKLTVGLAQIAPIWLDREATTKKIIDYIHQAIAKGCDLVTFGETILPGYPFWLELTDGAKFNNDRQKEIHAYYLNQAVRIGEGDLNEICATCREGNIALIVGIVELAADRANHSVYCSRIYINQQGEILSVHRKLMPTYEERLVWAIGDGHGLQVHDLEQFKVGSLNCWENWMPLARAALYAQGENLHVAIWPGGLHNTHDLTQMIAKESRSYVISVCGLMRREDIRKEIPHSEMMIANSKDFLANGGSCLSAPNGELIIEPQVGIEGLFVAEIDHEQVRRERQNFDPSGHYARPDVTQLMLNRKRQNILTIED